MKLIPAILITLLSSLFFVSNSFAQEAASLASDNSGIKYDSLALLILGVGAVAFVLRYICPASGKPSYQYEKQNLPDSAIDWRSTTQKNISTTNTTTNKQHFYAALKVAGITMVIVTAYFVLLIMVPSYLKTPLLFVGLVVPIIVFFSHMPNPKAIENKKRLSQKMDLLISAGNGFVASKQFMGIDGKSGIAVDEAQKKIYLTTFEDGSTPKLISGRLFDYKDIISCELFEDGVTVTKTVRSSQAVGALVGNVLLGGVGTIIGGLSGKTESAIGKVNRIDLRILVNDTVVPLHDLCFLATKSSKDGFVYKMKIEEARHWHGVLEVLIKRADAEERQVAKSADVVVSPFVPAIPQSLADEIKKLAELRDSGVLTAEEFQQQKNKLLAT